LSSVGFAPVNTSLLSGVLKTSWILIITGFNPFEVLGLFLFYVLAMPFWLTLYLAFRKHWNTGETAEEAEQSRTKTPWKWVFPTTALLFVAWFLLYGNATTKPQLLPGVFLCGLFSLILIYRLLLKPSPNNETKLPVLHWLTVLSYHIAKSTSDRIKKDNTNKSELEAARKINGFIRRLTTRLTYFIKSSLSRNRIPNYVLAEYLVSLVVVAGTCIVFWALLIKAGVYPQASFTTTFHLSASHFLPGVQPPETSPATPLWSNLGPAATAWVLFVLYIGPAASMLPEKQKSTVGALRDLYKLYRKSLLNLGWEKRHLQKQLREFY
jgi:hypothetical protein